MKKHDRLSALVAGLATDSDRGLDPCYEEYFRCFNQGQYYEAHDVLEHLWLQGGRTDANHAFYKGLIQLAGGFVHLRKHFEHPGHAKHGRRLSPAARLLLLAAQNLERYAPRHLELDVRSVCDLCHAVVAELHETRPGINPWSPDSRPQIRLDSAES